VKRALKSLATGTERALALGKRKKRWSTGLCGASPSVGGGLTVNQISEEVWGETAKLRAPIVRMQGHQGCPRPWTIKTYAERRGEEEHGLLEEGGIGGLLLGKRAGCFESEVGRGRGVKMWLFGKE